MLINFLFAVLTTLIIMKVVNCVIYPIVQGDLITAGQNWRYKVGRIPFVNAKRIYVYMYWNWRQMTSPESVMQLSQVPTVVIDKSYLQQLKDNWWAVLLIIVVIFIALEASAWTSQ